MGIQKSQPVNIIVNLDLPENLTWVAESTSLEAWLVEKLRVPVHVVAVKKLSDSEELAKSTTASVIESTGCSASESPEGCYWCAQARK